jgi:ABC-type transport system involved in multi-copper enzyme maturation permease subunit
VPGFVFDIDHAMRFLLILVLSVVYLSTFFTLGLLVSCLSRSSQMSLMICLFLWIVLVLAVPNLMPMLARGLRPIPSEGKVAMEKMHKRREVQEWAGNTIRAEIHDAEEYFQTVARLVAKALEGIDQFRRNRVQEQITLAKDLARVSPTACYMFAASDLSRTGIGSFSRYQRYVIWYRHLFNETKDHLMEQAQEEAEDGRWWNAEVSEKDLKLFPRFKPLEITFAESIGIVLIDAALLVAFNIVFFLAAYTAFLRYDAR